ncbi:hypothetical protein U1E44_05480 [Arenibacter sp. GZD96]|uniref:hypothetical protein n=1 Tax=Aurantibrevibacter litoralis TaxID=3106030 RepID=UPI002AFFF813|nr:hypothetical protein [Arenibacter sp. GZD-96]MEA1785532.1 hypothetical protein [Arenibacter sp. GZD-96]
MVDTLFLALRNYENEGIDSMDWAEWAGTDIEEKIVSCLTLEHWIEIKGRISGQSDHFKSLLISVIALNDVALAPVQLSILRNFVLHENTDVAFEALRKITFGFVTSGRDYETEALFHKKALKGVFSSLERHQFAQTYFDEDFKEKAKEIATDCADFYKDEIRTFLSIISEKDSF